MGRRPVVHNEDEACSYCGGSGISARAQVQRLKARRIDLWIPQKDIALALYVRTSTVSSWESGKNAPSVEDLRRYREFLDEQETKQL